MGAVTLEVTARTAAVDEALGTHGVTDTLTADRAVRAGLAAGATVAAVTL
jgi:hypothetical protein